MPTSQTKSSPKQGKEETEVFQPLSHVLGGHVVVLRDGRISGFSQPEPPHLQRRYEQARALREIQREARIREVLADESRGFVERIRTVLGLA
jgi:hypothetical protein